MSMAVGLASVAAAAAAGGPQTPAASQSASQLLHDALTDAIERRSFHSVETMVEAGQRVRVIADSGERSGRQTLVRQNGGRALLLVIDRAVYLSGNRDGLVKTLGLPIEVADFVGAGSVSVPQNYKSYETYEVGVTLRSALAQFRLLGRLTERSTTFRGRAVIAITGRAPKSAPGVGAETVFLSRAARPLPLYAELRFTGKNEKGSGVVSFSRWGEAVTVSAPPAAVSIGKLPAVELAGEGVAALHYGTFTGSHGDPPPPGRPWVNSQCKPIRLAAGRRVPAWAYQQMARVVDEARTDGIDVTLDSRDGSWNPKSLYYQHGQSPTSAAVVPVGATDAKPSKTQSHIKIGWDTQLTSHGKNEQFTHVTGQLWLRVIAGQGLSLRRAIRQLIALTEGVSGTNLRGSAIANLSTTDHFTLQDIAAMLQNSGCVGKSTAVSLGAAPTVTTPTTNSAGQPLKFPGS